jgi:SAM-dependent methyltransferase
VLLDAVALEKSEVVANACMNRQRNLAGANSYEKDLGFAPLDFLKKGLEKPHEAAWLDLCCGTGRALIQAAEVCRTASLDRRVRLTGVDLVPMFDSIPPGLDGVRLVAASVERWATEERFDLVTCVHGLHYIGDKLGLVQKASGWLRDGGLLLVHLDYRNLRINGRKSSGAQIGKDLRRAGFRYVPGRRLLIGSAQTPRNLLPYRYLGADDQAGPNYTGQAAVDSYYERARS